MVVHDYTPYFIGSRCCSVSYYYYISVWSGLSRSASISVVHLDQFMSTQSVIELYHQCHTNAYVSTRMKGDKLVNYTLDLILEKGGLEDTQNINSTGL